jgi:cytoskeleton protein RodZ
MAKGTFGERLKRERELREVSLNELTVGTRISGRYLEAFENEDWHKLPGAAFNRGFVRSIARYLGLDEENFLAEYDLAHGEQALPVPRPYENKIPRPPLWMPIAVVAGALLIFALLVAGGVYGWRLYAAHRAAKHSSSSTSLSAPVSPATPGSAQSGAVMPVSSVERQNNSGASTTDIPLDLSLSTSAATHVRIVGDGALLLDTQLPAGATRHFSGAQRFQVTADDSSAVLLELNGVAMPPIGTPGASGTIVLSQENLRQALGGTPQP